MGIAIGWQPIKRCFFLLLSYTTEVEMRQISDRLGFRYLIGWGGVGRILGGEKEQRIYDRIESGLEHPVLNHM